MHLLRRVTLAFAPRTLFVSPPCAEEPAAGETHPHLRLPAGWQMARRRLVQVEAAEPNRGEVAFEFELGGPSALRAPPALGAYALHHACLPDGGECRYLRHDFRIGLPPRR